MIICMQDKVYCINLNVQFPGMKQLHWMCLNSSTFRRQRQLVNKNPKRQTPSNYHSAAQIRFSTASPMRRKQIRYRGGVIIVTKLLQKTAPDRLINKTMVTLSVVTNSDAGDGGIKTPLRSHQHTSSSLPAQKTVRQAPDIPAIARRHLSIWGWTTIWDSAGQQKQAFPFFPANKCRRPAGWWFCFSAATTSSVWIVMK